MNWQQRATNLMRQGKIVNFWGHRPLTGGAPGWICQVWEEGEVRADDVELANAGPFPTMAAAFRAAEKAMKK